MSKYTILLRNLLARMEFNDRQNVYSLKGSITPDEREALRRALDALENQEKQARA